MWRGTKFIWKRKKKKPLSLNVTKTRVSEGGCWSRVPVAGAQRWQSGLLRPGRLNTRRVMMTKRHGRSTTWENGMEVETNSTCLAFQGREAAAVKTSPGRGWCRVTADGGTGWAWGGRTARWWGGQDTFRWRVHWVIFGLPAGYLEIEYNIDFLSNYALRVPLILTLNLN